MNFGSGVVNFPVGELPQRITGGWHVKDLDGGRCVDVLAMMYNYRVVLSSPDHLFIDHGWCYFGHGTYPDGVPRTMVGALTAAMLAAMVWDGVGAPVGFDKQAC